MRVAHVFPLVDIALPQRQDRSAPESIDQALGLDIAAERERGRQKAPAFGPVPPLSPVQPDRTHQPQRSVVVLAREQVLERRPQVRMLSGEPVQPFGPPSRVQLRTCAFAECDEPVRVTVVELARVREPFEPLCRELADRLEHPVAVAGAAEQALVDQRRDRVDVGAADLLGGLERAAAGEDGQPGEDVLLARRQQVMAPGDRRAQRALPLRRRARAPREQRQPLFESLEQDGRRESLHTSSGEFDRERQAIEAPADLGDLAVRDKVGADSQGTLHEEFDRFSLWQRIDGDLPLAVDVQRLAARDEHRQVRTGSDRLCDPGGRVEQMLEVVQHEQQALVADVAESVSFDPSA